MTKGTCSIEGCGRSIKYRGLCNAHYQRQLVQIGPPIRPTPQQRLWSYVDKNGPIPHHKPYLGPCWRWQGAGNGNGYGVMTVARRKVYVHRFSYELLVGPIPPGSELDHLCHNGDPDCVDESKCLHRSCCNPDHLEAVSRAINAKRGNGGQLQRAKTKCPQGHPYDEQNTKWYQGRRYCWACHEIRYGPRKTVQQ